MIDPVELARNAIERMEKEDIVVMYVGSVRDLTPSGKYYMPWACSNVTEEEAEEDEEWWNEFENELTKYGAWAETYEGDPLDVLVVR